MEILLFVPFKHFLQSLKAFAQKQYIFEILPKVKQISIYSAWFFLKFRKSYNIEAPLVNRVKCYLQYYIVYIHLLNICVKPAVVITMDW